MAYSTQTQLQNNVKVLEKTITDATERAALATERIALADKIIEVFLDKYVDFTNVDETVPVINLMSQYKSAEMTLRRLLGVKYKRDENNDITEWMRMFNELKDGIIDGSIIVEDASGTSLMTSVSQFENTGRPDVKPDFGWDRYGYWVDNDDLEIIRGNIDDSTRIEGGTIDR